MKDKNIIFHIPFKIDFNRASGSQIRPIKMIKAFEEIGYNVDIIQGYLKERSQKIKQIKRKIRSGANYEFVYSESSTAPTALTEKHHLPIRPFLDFKFFKFCRQNNVPIGLFYRDIYWNFEYYKKELSFLKRIFSVFFYKFDLKQYKKYINVLFLPHLTMYEAFPIKHGWSIKELPPATDLKASPSPNNAKLEIIYVGGIGEHYKMHKLFKVCKLNDNLNLNICCRSDDWHKFSQDYSKYISENIKIHHISGKNLINMYLASDVASIFVEPSSYRSFAMPLKLFEYLGYRKPIIATKNTAVGDFILKNDIGWVINYSEKELSNLLNDLSNNKKMINNKINNINAIISKNTWNYRADQVKSELTNYTKK